jgi:5-methylcytosine-specific restriction protein A
MEQHSTPRLRGRRGVEQRKRRLLRTDGLCEKCLEQGRYRVATVVNHKVPLIQGGSDEDDNTENLCREHDLVETAKQFGYKAPKPLIGTDGWPVTQECDEASSVIID